jgi:hypothetical protein
VNIAEHAASSSATTLHDDQEGEEYSGQEVEAAPTEVEDAVSWDVEGKNRMVDDEPDSRRATARKGTTGHHIS